MIFFIVCLGYSQIDSVNFEHGRFNHNCDDLFLESHAFVEVDP